MAYYYWFHPSFQILLSYISLKNENFRKSVEGNPTVIIKEGKLKFNEMSKLRYSLDDLITQWREQGIKSIEEVSYAVLENDGKLSVFQNTVDYPMPIIMDGVINQDVLSDINKNTNWVMHILKDKKLKLEDVFYAFYTKDKTINYYMVFRLTFFWY